MLHGKHENTTGNFVKNFWKRKRWEHDLRVKSIFKSMLPSSALNQWCQTYR
jgi:hypothetical protein